MNYELICYLCERKSKYRLFMEDNQLNRMQQLVDQLNQASDAYYNGRGELMTDYEWDARFDELKQL